MASSVISRNCLQSVSSEDVRLEMNNVGWSNRTNNKPCQKNVHDMQKIPLTLHLRNKVVPEPIVYTEKTIYDEMDFEPAGTHRGLLIESQMQDSQ